MGLVACGSTSTGDSGSVTPKVVAVKLVDAGVQVRYRASGAEGGDWPVLRISVRKTEEDLPATSQEARPIEEEGTVVVPIEVQPNQNLVVYGSIFYEDGKRVRLPEQHFRS
ncbi:MAG TPA: hypothetical protein VFZ19_04650 [Solirubrobacterales bacterium]